MVIKDKQYSTLKVLRQTLPKMGIIPQNKPQCQIPYYHSLNEWLCIFTSSCTQMWEVDPRCCLSCPGTSCFAQARLAILPGHQPSHWGTSHLGKTASAQVLGVGASCLTWALAISSGWQSTWGCLVLHHLSNMNISNELSWYRWSFSVSTTSDCYYQSSCLHF